MSLFDRQIKKICKNIQDLYILDSEDYQKVNKKKKKCEKENKKLEEELKKNDKFVMP